VVIYFPIHSDSLRSEKDVTIFEKASLAVEAQRWWSDNGVSVTVSFDAETEANHVETILSMYDGQLKAISFLPMGNKVYPQQPYTNISSTDYVNATNALSKVDMDVLYDEKVLDAEGEKYCTTDVCEIPKK
jgi:ribonucleoside-triphosphate reductase